MRRYAGLKDLTLPSQTPRLFTGEPELCGFCAGCFSAFTRGCPYTITGATDTHRHYCTVRHSYTQCHTPPTHRLALPSLLPGGGVRSQQGSPAHQELLLAGPVSFRPTGWKCSSSFALLLKSLANPSPSLLSPLRQSPRPPPLTPTL